MHILIFYEARIGFVSFSQRSLTRQRKPNDFKD